MKKLILLLGLFFGIVKFSFCQTLSCGQAVYQLQSYAAQVNQAYYNEYWTFIPQQRCPQYDQWERPFNPQIVQNCRWQMYTYLNQWYAQQCNYVNNWYAQIVRGCSIDRPVNIPSPAPRPIQGGDENNQIDTEEIKDLTVGIDEEKAIKISIPKTASGFKPRQ